MKNNIFQEFKYTICSHTKNNLQYIILGILAVVIGVVFGFALSGGDKSYYGILGKVNKNFLSYISGTANTIEIFWHHFLLGLYAFAIIFLFCLNYYSSFLSLAYICYQSCVFILATTSLTSLYGFSAILSSILYLVPINMVSILIIVFYYSICASRSKLTIKKRTDFSSSFSTGFWLLVSTCIVTYFVFLLAIDFILPILFRGIYIINY